MLSPLDFLLHKVSFPPSEIEPSSRSLNSNHKILFPILVLFFIPCLNLLLTLSILNSKAVLYRHSHHVLNNFISLHRPDRYLYNLSFYAKNLFGCLSYCCAFSEIGWIVRTRLDYFLYPFHFEWYVGVFFSNVFHTLTNLFIQRGRNFDKRLQPFYLVSLI